MTAQMIRAIEAALIQGHRVQLKQMKDGSVKVQIVTQKELKLYPTPEWTGWKDQSGSACRSSYRPAPFLFGGDTICLPTMVPS